MQSSCVKRRHLKANLSDKAKDFIQQRKQARRIGNKVGEVEASKLLRKELRAIKRASGVKRIEKILADFRGLGQIADIRANGKRRLLTSVKDLGGTVQSSRQGIVDAFAEF